MSVLTSASSWRRRRAGKGLPAAQGKRGLSWGPGEAATLRGRPPSPVPPSGVGNSCAAPRRPVASDRKWKQRASLQLREGPGLGIRGSTRCQCPWSQRRGGCPASCSPPWELGGAGRGGRGLCLPGGPRRSAASPSSPEGTGLVMGAPGVLRSHRWVPGPVCARQEGGAGSSCPMGPLLGKGRAGWAGAPVDRGGARGRNRDGRQPVPSRGWLTGRRHGLRRHPGPAPPPRPRPRVQIGAGSPASGRGQGDVMGSVGAGAPGPGPPPAPPPPPRGSFSDHVTLTGQRGRGPR